MDKAMFKYVLVVVIAFLVGFGIVAKQQSTILQTQNRIEGKIGQNDNSNTSAKVEMLNSKIGFLESRLSSLEGKLNAIGMAAGGQPQAPQRQMPPAPDLNKVHEIPVAHSPIIGPKDAKVTITEFVDFQCPFCTRFHSPILEVLKTYPNDVRYIIKNFPLDFHPHARPAAKFSLAAAEQGKYKEAVDKIFENSKNLNDETYKKIAQELGMDVNKMEQDLKNNDTKYEQMINDDMQLGASVDVMGTPSFYINGKSTFARDFQSFKTEIDKILGK